MKTTTTITTITNVFLGPRGRVGQKTGGSCNNGRHTQGRKKRKSSTQMLWGKTVSNEYAKYCWVANIGFQANNFCWKGECDIEKHNINNNNNNYNNRVLGSAGVEKGWFQQSRSTRSGRKKRRSSTQMLWEKQ